jgi:hypothetical protein
MKKAVIALVALFLALNIVTAHANNIVIDGDASGNAEWNSVSNTELIRGKGDHITSADMKCFIDSEKDTVYYLFTGKNAFGVIIRLNGLKNETASDGTSLDKIVLKYPEISDGASQKTFNAETDNVLVEAALDIPGYDNSPEKTDRAMFCEVKVKYKVGGVGEKESGSVQFYDKDGNTTAEKRFSFDRPGVSGETEKTTEAEKTTKKKAGSTTKATTTKREISTSRVQTTTKAHTTKAAKTSAAEVSTTAEKVKTTKAPKTTAHKVKTTRSRKTAEKSAAETSAPVTVIYAVTESSAELQTQAETTAPSAFDLKNLPRSTLMKIAAGAGALILFGAIGIAAVRSGNSDKKDEEDNTDKTGED